MKHYMQPISDTAPATDYIYYIIATHRDAMMDIRITLLSCHDLPVFEPHPAAAEESQS